MTIANKFGQSAHASGRFGAQGDAQHSYLVARNSTSDATPTALFLNGSTDRITIADDTAWTFRAEVVGVTVDAAKHASYIVTGLCKRNNGTVTVAGVATATIAESESDYDATAVADDTNKALVIQVTGKAGDTIRWVASVHLTEVTFPGA